MTPLRNLADRQRLMRDKNRRNTKTGARLAESGIEDLPPEIAVRVEEALNTPAAEVEPPKPADATVEELVARLTSIRERLFHLSAVFAVSLSWDCAIESNRYLAIFQELAADLQRKDEQAYQRLIEGHESILCSPTIPTKRSIPVEVQRDAELRWEISQTPVRREPERSADAIPDGLGWAL